MDTWYARSHDNILLIKQLSYQIRKTILVDLQRTRIDPTNLSCKEKFLFQCDNSFILSRVFQGINISVTFLILIACPSYLTIIYKCPSFGDKIFNELEWTHQLSLV